MYKIVSNNYCTRDTLEYTNVPPAYSVLEKGLY